MEILRDIIIKLGLAEEDYNHLLELTTVYVFQEKELLLTSGNICNFIGFVEEGTLRIYREKDGDEYIGDFHVAGSFSTSYRSFISAQPSVASIQALQKTKVRMISKKVYDALLNESPLWYKFGKYIIDNLFIKKCIKENSLLMDSAHERYKLLLKTYPRIEQDVSQYHIASYLGIKPESLSRIKSLNIGQ